MSAALLLALLWVSGPARGEPDGGASAPSLPVAAQEGGDVLLMDPPAADPPAGTAASGRPLLPPARTPLYERPVEVLWWALFWLPEHWRGEAIAWLLGLLTSLSGYVASRVRLRDSDPDQYSRRDPRRWIVAAFSDRPLPGQATDDTADTDALEAKVSRLNMEVRKLQRTEVSRQEQQAKRDATILSAVGRLGASDADALRRLERLLTDALEDDGDAPRR